jgi:filamentous hemagglutinin
VASQVTAGGSLTAEAGKAGAGDLVVAGSTLASGGAMSLKAADELVIASVQDTSSSSYSSSNKGTWSSKTLDKTASSSTVVKSELKSGDDMGLESSDGGVTIKASKLESGGSVRLESASGEIALLTDTSSTFSQEKKSGSNVVWQSTRDKGAYDQVVEHTEITATGAIQVIAAQGIRVEYRDTGNVDDSITQLSKQPGLAWMEQLRGDPRVNWQAVAEAHQNWDYKSEGLTGAGAALLSLAVAVATYGVGSGLESLVTEALTESLGAAWATGASMAGSAAQAGFASLCSQAAVGLVNNKGDVLATLQGLASDQGMRALASAMLTASLITGANAGLAKIDGLKDAVKAGDWAGKAVQDTLVTGTVQAGVGTALYGGDLGQNLLDGLRGAAVDSLGADLATRIGDAAKTNKIDNVSRMIAHAALGGAMAAADGGDAASGALGAVVGEVAAQAFLEEKLKKGISEKDLPALEERGVNLAKLAAGMAAAVAGADVDTAAHTADNAARNNALDTIWDGLCILYDSGKIAYGLYKDDKGMVREGFIDLAGDTAAFFIPMVPAGMTRLARAGKAAEAADKATDAIKATERADNVVNAERLRKQLAGEEAGSLLFTAEGKLTKEALGRATELKGIKLGNPNIPAGYTKYTIPIERTPTGKGEIHFYGKPGPNGVEPWYGLDYKVKLTPKK